MKNYSERKWRLIMKKLVVYDSYFGNTAAIAERIAHELECDHIKIHAFDANTLNQYDLIVIGSPTRMFTTTKAIRQLVKNLERFDQKIVFFDTRMKIEEAPKVLKWLSSKFGYSNDTLEKVLKKRKRKVFVDSGRFYVQDTEGPLFEEELHNAEAFSKTITSRL